MVYYYCEQIHCWRDETHKKTPTDVGSEKINNCCTNSFNDSNEIRTHNYLVRKPTLNHLAKLASLAKCLSVRLKTKWLWVRIIAVT